MKRRCFRLDGGQSETGRCRACHRGHLDGLRYADLRAMPYFIPSVAPTEALDSRRPVSGCQWLHQTILTWDDSRLEDAEDRERHEDEKGSMAHGASAVAPFLPVRGLKGRLHLVWAIKWLHIPFSTERSGDAETIPAVEWLTRWLTGQLDEAERPEHCLGDREQRGTMGGDRLVVENDVVDSGAHSLFAEDGRIFGGWLRTSMDGSRPRCSST